MPIIAWDDSFSMCVPQLDAHHQRLVELINAFYEAIKTGQDPAAMRNVLDQLKATAEAHFQAEKALLEAHGFPGLERHAQEHRTLVRELKSLLRDCDLSSPEKQWTIFEYLDRWTLKHFIESDKKYAHFFASLNLA